MKIRYGLQFLVFFSLSILFLYSISIIFRSSSPNLIKPSIKISFPTERPKNLQATKHSFLFVPSWTVDMHQKISTRFDHDFFIYFGLPVINNSIDVTAPELVNIPIFKENVDKNSKQLLAIIMHDQEANLLLLHDQNLQRALAVKIVAYAKEKNFQGIVLDFELKALPFHSVIDGTTTISQTIAASARKEKLLFYQTIYGDVWYRLRPFDVKKIASFSDGLLFLAYDLHKRNGEPGPNFPFSGKKQYGYDLQNLVKDVLNEVPKEKITVVFGFYGYDWIVDEKQHTLIPAQAVTYTNMTTFLSSSCRNMCKKQRDYTSQEMHITSKDQNEKNHSIWFDDIFSIEKKTDYLKTKGIESIGYWAYSYF